MINFILWHYSKGIKNLFQIWENYFIFSWNYFSIGRFAKTLLSPWRRDVSRVGQRGFHPVLFFQIILENTVTRFLGAIVKSGVMFFGIIMELGVFIFGFLIFILWLFLPLFLLGSSAGAFFYFQSGFGVGTLLCFISFILSAWVLAISIFAWFESKKNYSLSNIPGLAREGWFEKVWNRTGEDGVSGEEKILLNKPAFEKYLLSVDMKEEEFLRVVQWEMNSYLEKKKARQFWGMEKLSEHAPIGRYWSYSYTVHLDQYAIDLSDGDYSEYRNAKLVGKQDDVEEIKRMLLRGEQNNVILIGEPGVGRDTIIHSLAREIRNNASGTAFEGERILELDIKAIIAGSSSQNEIDQLLGKLFGEAAYAGNITLIIRNIHEYFSAPYDILGALSQYLSLPSFRIIGTTTSSDFHSIIEKKSNIMKYCGTIIVSEMSADESMQVVYRKIKGIERGQVFFTYQAIRELVNLAERYISDAPFPEKALDLLEEIILYWSTSIGEGRITKAVVSEAVSKKIKVPLGEVTSGESEKLLNLEQILHKRIIGQETAIREIAETMRRARIGMSEKNKPIGSFLFLGSTGVGKTESAKALAEAYFGDENRMIRLDMSEYQTSESIDRLIGSQVTGREGYLVTKVKENPYALLLLDEIEKAFPDILNLFLQVLDEGHLTDAFGKKINFRNLIIIATSNAGAEVIKEALDKKLEAKLIQKKLVDYVIKENIFRPELLNRFEGVIFFHALSQADIYKVVQMLLDKYTTNLKQQENIEINFQEGLIEKVATEAYDPVFGARAINRYIQDKIGDVIVKKIISGEIKKGEKFDFSVSNID